MRWEYTHHTRSIIHASAFLLPLLPPPLSPVWLSMSDDKLWPVWNLHLVLSLFNNRWCRNHSSLAAIVPPPAPRDYSPSFSCTALSYRSSVYRAVCGAEAGQQLWVSTSLSYYLGLIRDKVTDNDTVGSMRAVQWCIVGLSCGSFSRYNTEATENALEK